MHFYSMSYREALETPIYTFWTLFRGIDRLKAEDDLRMYELLATVVGGDGKKFVKRLQGVIGEVFKIIKKPKLDREGLESLKRRMGNH